jgi:hypothetical protein
MISINIVAEADIFNRNPITITSACKLILFTRILLQVAIYENLTVKLFKKRQTLSRFLNEQFCIAVCPRIQPKICGLLASVPPTYEIDPYTGKSIIVTQGYEIVNRTVQFTIKNQPFTPQIDSNGNQVSLYYHIRYKGHYENSWSDNSHEMDGRTIFSDTLVFPASNTTYTEISIVYLIDGVSDWSPLNYVPLPNEGLIDFQVQAALGQNYFGLIRMA